MRFKLPWSGMLLVLLNPTLVARVCLEGKLLLLRGEYVRWVDGKRNVWMTELGTLRLIFVCIRFCVLDWYLSSIHVHSKFKVKFSVALCVC